jgi:hypothetical protein
MLRGTYIACLARKRDLGIPKMDRGILFYEMGVGGEGAKLSDAMLVRSLVRPAVGDMWECVSTAHLPGIVPVVCYGPR